MFLRLTVTDSKAYQDTDETVVVVTDNGPYDDSDTTGGILDPFGLGKPPAAYDDDSTCFIGSLLPLH